MPWKHILFISALLITTQLVFSEEQPRMITEEEVHDFGCQEYMAHMRETTPKLVQAISVFIRSKTYAEQKKTISDLGFQSGWLKGIIESWNQDGCKPSMDTPWSLPEETYPYNQSSQQTNEAFSVYARNSNKGSILRLIEHIKTLKKQKFKFNDGSNFQYSDLLELEKLVNETVQKSKDQDSDQEIGTLEQCFSEFSQRFKQQSKNHPTRIPGNKLKSNAP